MMIAQDPSVGDQRGRWEDVGLLNNGVYRIHPDTPKDEFLI